MPGTLRKKLKVVEQLEEEVFGFYSGLRLIMPEQYLKKPDDFDTADTVRLAWFAAFWTATRLKDVMELLGNKLRNKAGIAEPGPIARLRADGPEQDPTDSTEELLTAAEADAIFRRLVGGEGEKMPPARPAAGRRERPLELLPASVFKSATASQLEVVEWVAANLVIAEAQPENAPGPLAWAMLQDLRADSTARAAFLASFTKVGLAAKEQESKGDPGLANIKKAMKRLEEIRASVAKKETDTPSAAPIEPRAGGRA